MPPSKGYRSYRGRSSGLKIALAVVLVMVILASLSFVALTRYIAYDEDGTPFLRLPERQEDPEDPPPQQNPEEDPLLNGDIKIEGPEEVEPVPEPLKTVRAFSLPEEALTAEGWQKALEQLEEAQEQYDAVVYLVKDFNSNVYFNTGSEVSGFVRKAKKDTAEAIAAMNQSDYHTIARRTCFHDFKTANANMESMGLKNTGGRIFYDGDYTTWLDPAKPEARKYIRDMVMELVDLGFDEILLTGFSYPTKGNLDKVAYSAEDTLYADLEQFLQELKEALADSGVILSMELTEKAVTQGFDENAGLRLENAASTADRIYLATTGAEAPALREMVEAVSETASFLPELENTGEIQEPDKGYLILP